MAASIERGGGGAAAPPAAAGGPKVSGGAEMGNRPRGGRRSRQWLGGRRSRPTIWLYDCVSIHDGGRGWRPRRPCCPPGSPQGEAEPATDA